MAFKVSPGVFVTEKDLTTIVPQIATTAAGFAGAFQWGPADEITIIDNINNLVETFGKPTDATYEYFFSAANFLSYGSNLQMVRVVNSDAKNAVAAGTAIVLKNLDDYLSNRDTYAANLFAAKYPGVLGNSLDVYLIDSNHDGSAINITYGEKTIDIFDLFSAVPDTSNYAKNRGFSNAKDEIHVAVVDRLGKFSGVPGTVLEVFPFCSKLSDGKRDDGSSAYYVTVLANESKYVWNLDHPDTGGDNTSSSSNIYVVDWGITLDALGYNTFDKLGDPSGLGDGIYRGKLGDTTPTSGVDGNTLSSSDLIDGFDKFADVETTDISIIIAGPAPVAVQQHIIDNIVDERKDCVAVVSPPKADVVGVADIDTQTDNVVEWFNDELNRSSSYFVADSGWKLQYDRWNDTNRYVPLNADIAGLMVRTDETNDPWYSPAGYTRGQIKNVIKLAYNPRQTHRDILYKNSINPVVSKPGEGTILFGDKTGLDRPSAFDRINVRRLFIVLEKAIATASKFGLFEFNDAFTRSQFVSIIEPFLRDVQARRGIFDFRVVCDETNNTAAVIDRNEFVGDIYVKPARSINYIILNFTAARTDVSFDEIGG